MTLYLNGTTGISGVDGSAGTPAVQGTDTNTGISFPAADTIAVNTGGSERVRCDSSGRVGIGTTSPSGLLHVKAATNKSLLAQDGGADTIELANYDASDGYRNFRVSGSSLRFHTGTAGGSSAPERARIDDNGRLLVGTSSISSGDGQIYVQQDAINIRNLIALNNTGAGSTTAGVAAFYRQGTYTGGITNTNSSSAFVTSSDYRLKENIVPLDNAVDRINQLQVRRFNFIADPGNTLDGFIAHEVQQVVPEAIFGEKDAVDDDGNPVYQGIDQSKLVPLLTAALQELVAEVEGLKAEVTALKAQ